MPLAARCIDLQNVRMLQVSFDCAMAFFTISLN